jgi:hypothetical protein
MRAQYFTPNPQTSVKVYKISFEDTEGVISWALWQAKTFNWLNLGVILLMLTNLEKLRVQTAVQEVQRSSIHAVYVALDNRKEFIIKQLAQLDNDAAYVKAAEVDMVGYYIRTWQQKFSEAALHLHADGNATASSISSQLEDLRNSTVYQCSTRSTRAVSMLSSAKVTFTTHVNAVSTSTLRQIASLASTTFTKLHSFSSYANTTIPLATSVLMSSNATLHDAKALLSRYTTPRMVIYKTSGSSGTYVVPTNPAPRYLKVRMVGGGGGGGGSGTSTTGAGSAGTASSFAGGGITLTAGGGETSAPTGGGGLGGTASVSGVAQAIALTGGGGGSGNFLTTGYTVGAIGGSSMFGGAGAGNNAAGGAAAPGSGSGGGGGACGLNDACYTSGGGGGGAYIETLLAAPFPASFAYSVGAGGSGGPGSSRGNTGGAGAGGAIFIEALYW